ncbi:QRFP-like peptide receptor [Littorina saxatilis]|uniref:QRFP-like peptide receptor n=1 Tax=Littorina saxatilis TaxID=31220 RepID=UPI0038B50C4E
MTSLSGNSSSNSSGNVSIAADDYYDYYNYEYDYDDSINNIPLQELIPVTLTYTLTLLLGLIGNCLVIFSISYYRRMRTVTNVFLLSLASADLLLVLVCVPIKAAAFWTFSWEFGEVMCRGVNYVQSYSMICSILTLTVISMERLVAVVFPLQAKYLCTMRHAQLVVLGVWTFSAALAVPTFFIYIHQEVGEVRKAFWCVKNHSERTWIITYEMFMVTLLFVVPMCVMIMAYSVIAVKVWRVSDMRTGGCVPADQRQRPMSKSESGERSLLGNGNRAGNSRGGRQLPDEKETRKQVVAMLVAVLLLFALCWGPILINNVLTAWGHLHQLHYGYLKPMRQAFFLLSYFNSCINPLVYAFFSRNFRQSFKMAICACVKGKAFVRAYRYSISMASTRTSVVHSNGRTLTSMYERDAGTGSSENDMTRSPTSYSPESLELQKMSV